MTDKVQKIKECMFTKDNYTDEDRKVLCNGCEEECEFNKKEEPVSEDLEEAAENYASTDKVLPNGKVMIDFQAEKAFRAGANWQKQQMMKEAVKVKISNASIVSIPVNCNLKVGDKVLIIKEK